MCWYKIMKCQCLVPWLYYTADITWHNRKSNNWVSSGKDGNSTLCNCENIHSRQVVGDGTFNPFQSSVNINLLAVIIKMDDVRQMYLAIVAFSTGDNFSNSWKFYPQKSAHWIIDTLLRSVTIYPLLVMAMLRVPGKHWFCATKARCQNDSVLSVASTVCQNCDSIGIM